MPTGTPTDVVNPDFTLTVDNGGADCTLSVTVTDVDTVTALPRGGSNTADVTIATGPEVVPVGITDLSCTFSTSGSSISNYHVRSPARREHSLWGSRRH